MIVHPVPASPRAFACFGSVAGAPAHTPTSQGPDYKFWSDLAHYAVSGETEIGICTVYRQPSPTVAAVERHLQTPEILIPIDGPFVVPLLLEDRPMSDMKAFRVNVGEAIVINPRVWHGPCLPVDAEQSSYFVIFRRGTPGTDVEKRATDPVTVAQL